MTVPGSNLLNRARKLIKFQQVQYYKASGRTLNAVRQYVPSFDVPFTLSASVQAVNRNTYHAMSLDFNKFYVSVFASLQIIDLQRDTSGDRFIYNGDLYQMSNGQSWYEQDGWATCLAVRIKTAANGPNDV